ncbi:TetR/AcrR family transcriptional regulator [Longispora fulva]|uniref:AcrR family transcriptional regulator n=1 Tax=Longispora fulva TaxID=619741 RepID=A0A8J7GKZ2_9ACTN|nr:TetR/AcrR family transcriptional regulator [Longispora fulva]MBG6134894.1 AcrR family transcriptional regulator [Longispora fulva]
MAEEGTVVWNRERRAPRRQSLDVDRIVAASVALADAEGLDALSMRRVAADLGTGTTSLYRHVAGRDELVDLMTDAVQGEAPPVALTGDWRSDLRAVAHRQRAALLCHPWLGPVMATRPALGPNSLRQMDTALGAAGALTDDITLASDVMAVVVDYVVGAVSRELAELQARRRTGITEQEWRASVGPYIRQVVASGEYPRFARRVVEAADHTAEELFAFGLSCVLDGIAARVASSPPTAGP